ncbi:MAG: permease prefix domain 1-containing protein [Bifidobacteriaceae bacterium]|jgi:hypothetical protein|nr:permease prefix domain 1-containing protein [Bifidobacteriaceae bacterium]
MNASTGLEDQIEAWRSHALRQRALSPDDVVELEDHLREQIAELQASGFDHEEAFLVAIKRLGKLDAVSREFARQHSDRLWKQLVLLPTEPGYRAGRREAAVAVALGIGAGLSVWAGSTLVRLQHLDEWTFTLNAGFLVWPWLVGYFAWKRPPSRGTAASLVGLVAALALAVNLYPFTGGGATQLLVALHLPLALWFLAGVAYCGGWSRLTARLMDFVRFSGEIAIYYLLIALGGGALVGLTLAILNAVGTHQGNLVTEWIMPIAAPGALLVAAWLVEAKQSVIENIAPVLTRVFTPITMLMLLVLLPVLLASGNVDRAGREQLILFDAVLIVVAALLLYAVSAREPAAPPGLFDWLHLGLVVAALAVDAVALATMAGRVAEFGASPNKLAALGLNLLLAVHLAGAGWLSLRFVRGRAPFSAMAHWQVAYLPVYAAWAAAVVLVFPPVFAFQ